MSDARFQLCKCSKDNSLLVLGVKTLPAGTNPRQEFLTHFPLSRPAAPHFLWVILPPLETAGMLPVEHGSGLGPDSALIVLNQLLLYAGPND